MLAYYFMKSSKIKNNIDFEDYYNNLRDADSDTEDSSLKCRVCLQEGFVSIFSNDDDTAFNFLEALQNFGGVQINENDNYPKYLCKICSKFIQTAILFRKVAKKSDEALRKPVKEESVFDQCQDSHHGYSDDSTSETKLFEQKWSNEDKNYNVKKEKKEKIKYAAKVTCNNCGKVVNRSYYKEHMTMHDPDHKKYVCDVCGKSFRLRCAYHNHSLRHRNDFPYKCQFCPYKGRYSELLKTHMRTHTGDYRYMCTECPARFLFKSNLNSHMLKHKEPEYKCEACKRAFHTKLMLQRHFEADHLGIKNHVCNMCGKAFGYRNAMMKHQRHVHKREKLLFGRMPSYLEAEQGKHKGNL